MKHLLTAILMLIFVALQAQVTININGKINNIPSKTTKTVAEYSKKIDSIVLHERVLMRSEVKAVDDALKNGEISETEAERQKEEIADLHASNIEDQVDLLSDELEDLIQEQVEVSLYDEMDGDYVEADITIEKEKEKYKRLSNIAFSEQIGFTNFSENSNLNSASDARVNFGKSMAYSFGTLAHFQPTITSPFTLITGLQFRTANFRADDGYYYYEDAAGNFTVGPTPYERQRKNKLRINSLQIPVGFKFSFNKKKYDDVYEQDYRNVKKGFYVGMLGYGGINLSSKSIVKYHAGNNDHRSKDKINLSSINNVYYGLEFNFGYRGYNFYFRKDLSDTFDKTNLPINQNYEFGMRFGF